MITRAACSRSKSMHLRTRSSSQIVLAAGGARLLFAELSVRLKRLLVSSMESYQAFLFRKKDTQQTYVNADFPAIAEANGAAVGSHLLSCEEKSLGAWSLAAIEKSGGTYVQCPVCFSAQLDGSRRGLLDFEWTTSCCHWMCVFCWEALRKMPVARQTCPMCRASLSRALTPAATRCTVRDLLLDGETAEARCRATENGCAVSVLDFLAWVVQGMEGVNELWAHMETSRTDICASIRYIELDPDRSPLVVTAVIDVEDATCLCAHYMSFACQNLSARARARQLFPSQALPLWHVYILPLGFYVDIDAHPPPP